MKVALVAFHGDVGPLVDQSWERTSISEEGFFIAKACLGDDGVDGM